MLIRMYVHSSRNAKTNARRKYVSMITSNYKCIDITLMIFIVTTSYTFFSSFSWTFIVIFFFFFLNTERKHSLFLFFAHARMCVYSVCVCVCVEAAYILHGMEMSSFQILRTYARK